MWPFSKFKAYEKQLAQQNKQIIELKKLNKFINESSFNPDNVPDGYTIIPPVTLVIEPPGRYYLQTFLNIKKGDVKFTFSRIE